MGELKDTWKKTGKGLGTAFKNLGLSVLKTGKNVINKLDSDDKHKDEKQADELACNRAEKDKE